MKIDETLEATTNDVERGTWFLRRTTKSWNIPLNSLFEVT